MGTAVLRQAGRSLLRRPFASAVAALTVAAATAAITATFVLVHAALLAPLPFAQPDRLIAAEVISTKGYSISISAPNYRDWSEWNRVFTKTAASAGWRVILSGRGAARVLRVREVLGDFFGTLGLVAGHGRLLSAAETARGAAPLAVLGHSFFRELGGSPRLVGSALTLDGRAYTVVGVLPPDVGYPSPDVQAYLPLGALGDEIPWQDRDSGFGLGMLGRLRSGVSLAAAQRDLDRVTRRIQTLEGRRVETARLRTLADLLVGDLRQPLLLLFAAAALVVGLAVGNVANLFLARAEGRRGEFALRTAIGAPRGHVVRLLLAESAWIGVAGGAIGIAGAAVLVSLIAHQVGGSVPSFVAARLHLAPPALAFAGALIALLTLALGALPAWVLPSGSLGDALHAVRGGGTRGASRLRSGLVVGELALGTVLLVGAGLLVSSLERLRHVDKGFDPSGVVAGRLALPDRHFADKPAWLAFYRALLAAAERQHGVRAACLALLMPLSDRSWELRVFPEGAAIEPHGGDSVLFNIVTPGYFATLRAGVVRGRGFGTQDRDGSQPVAVVDETLAARFWPGRDPIGRQITLEFDRDNPHAGAPGTVLWRTIVGVVKNLRHYELQSPSRIQAYIPLEQTYTRWGMGLELAVRTDGAVAALPPRLSRLAVGIDPDVPITEVQPLAANLDRAIAHPLLLSQTVTAFGALALLLAGVGVFAVASLGVVRRQRELGIRQAVGATPRDLLGAVLGQAVRWWAAGAAIGLAGAAIAARLARALLFGVGTLDLKVYAAAIVLLLAVALLACLAPGVRAMRADPASILREEA